MTPEQEPEDVGGSLKASEPLLYATPAVAAGPRFGREAFGLLVRTAGLLLVLYAMRPLLNAVYGMVGFAWDAPLATENYVVEAALYLVLGAALIRGGWLVRLAYGRRD